MIVLWLVAAMAGEPESTDPSDVEAPADAQSLPSMFEDAAEQSVAGGPPPIAPEPAPKKESWFKRMHYEVGFSAQEGVGTDSTGLFPNLVVEPAAFEWRSFLTDKVAFHTTLNLFRMVEPAIALKDGRIDYDCHLGGHIPVADGLKVVVAPGAAIAYSFTKSKYQRIVGDARIGVDMTHGLWTTGLYLRPYAGWYREMGVEHGHVVGGVVIDLVGVVRLPKKSERAAR